MQKKYKLKIVSVKNKSDVIILNNLNDISFKVKRFFYINTDTKEERGHHAHKKCNQIIFCLKGKIQITLDDGKVRKHVYLNKKGYGLKIPQKIWSEQIYEKNSSAIILCDQVYKEDDYIRRYNDYKKYKFKK